MCTPTVTFPEGKITRRRIYDTGEEPGALRQATCVRRTVPSWCLSFAALRQNQQPGVTRQQTRDNQKDKKMNFVAGPRLLPPSPTTWLRRKPNARLVDEIQGKPTTGDKATENPFIFLIQETKHKPCNRKATCHVHTVVINNPATEFCYDHLKHGSNYFFV